MEKTLQEIDEITGKDRASEMDGMRKIARVYYEKTASGAEKNLIQKFFKKLDANGDGKASLMEFNMSVSSWYSDETMFRQLDTTGDGTLCFSDVLALYYMEKKHLAMVNVTSIIIGTPQKLVIPAFANPVSLIDWLCRCCGFLDVLF
ncbi:hypothetical protein BUALT_Bualt14G0053500 [Buddleja alternifolia]|uniref:EF-hand domain-containing protein n=1 Tax=Buddleja alternifolia TaxID=168488 RepID=A0AAV6WS33_9LAMI|nr:hypothetical protein BUALT_Bualt14G0053500 [Buddleja alternifolia]